MNPSLRPRALYSLSLVAGLAVPMVAQADDPVADTWFETDHDFASDDCSPASLGVCKLSIDGATMDCQTTKATDDPAERLGAIAYLVRNETDDLSTDICGGSEYCLFGALKTNTGTSTEVHFYCRFDGNDIETILLRGTNEHDELYFHHSQNGEFDLEGHGGVALVTGVMQGKFGDDQLHGSRSASADVKDDIGGDQGDDTIDTHAGDDIARDGADDDVILTGPGKDTVYLDSGTNQVSTEDDNDTVYGGVDEDHVHLGDGDDKAYLAAGDDVGCGGDGDDDVQGEDDDDKLWGDVGDADELDGGGEVVQDRCSPADYPGANTDCETADLTSEPPECPAEHPTGSD